MSNQKIDTREALNAYFETVPSYCEPYGNGHINDTFLVVAERRYILQRMNTVVFPHPEELMENIIGVTEHIRKKAEAAGGDVARASLVVVPTLAGKKFFCDSTNHYWRLYEFTEGTKTQEVVESVADFESCAEAFGNFQQQLADYPAHLLHESIVNFHNTPWRYENLMKAVAEDRCGRLAEVEAEVEFAREREQFCKTLEKAREEGSLPLRVTHNDTKLNNILFDAETSAPICVIDLDTVMPGYSVTDFGDSIRFGLGAVKNVGRGLIRSMAAKRAEGGPFRSLEDFIQRMGDELNKRAVENFIKCGAMDCFGHHRSELLAVYENMMDSIASSRKKNLEGQIGLFSMMQEEDTAVAIPIPSLPELDKAELMLMEKETTGIYISGHPMDDYRHLLRGTHVVPIGELMNEESAFQDDQIISVAGVIQTMKMKTTRNNSMMAYVTLEDDTAAIEMLAFSNVLNQYGGYLRENQPVVITGRLSMREDKEPQIVINRARPMSDYMNNSQPQQTEPVAPPMAGTLYLKLPTEEGTLFSKIRAILSMFPGENKVVVYFADTKIKRGSTCALDQRMLNELADVLGKDCVIVK